MRRGKFLFMTALIAGVLALAGVSVAIFRAVRNRPVERPHQSGWIPPGTFQGSPVTLDINKDTVPDIRAIGEGVFELRTVDGWVSFHHPPMTVLTPVLVRFTSGPEPEELALFIQGDDGVTYKFALARDSSFTVFQGDLGEIRPHGATMNSGTFKNRK